MSKIASSRVVIVGGGIGGLSMSLCLKRIGAEPVSKLKDFTDDEIRQLLLEVHKGWKDPIEKIIQYGHSMIKTPIYDIEHLPRWSNQNGNVILIGDAAHAVSPHSGQGASMALEDTYILTQYLKQYPPNKAAILFENSRKKRVERIVAEGRRSAGSKRETGQMAAFFRDLFVRHFIPPFIQRSAKELYDYDINISK
jgi:2-polyprenyl-6-methoxyphenol hydroxylase-like FAD-dependent oxidoreductase